MTKIISLNFLKLQISIDRYIYPKDPKNFAVKKRCNPFISILKTWRIS
jgi:hypothetical protein